MNDIETNTGLLIQAAQDGNAEEVQRLIFVSDPKFNESAALRMAAEKGHFECVTILAPVSEPKSMNSKVLEWAAYIGHLEMLQFLIPLCNPKDRNSYSLQMALYSGHLACVDELLLVSDPIAAWNNYRPIYSKLEDDWRILEERMAHCQNKLLREHIDDRAPFKTLNKKM